VPAMIVMIGNFSSKRGGAPQGGASGGAEQGADYLALRDGFASLAGLIERHDKIKVWGGGCGGVGGGAGGCWRGTALMHGARRPV
jgi:hypothetical protein